MLEKIATSVQSWLPFEQIYENGIIKLKNKSYVKVIKIYPINYNLKSNLEKEAILNSYKVFLKTCNFNIQILIQSKKEDISKHISKIKDITKEEKNLKELSEKYIKYIENKNRNSKSSSKNYYIIIKEEENKNKNISEKIYQDKLNEKYFKIKECLSRCGNTVYEISEREEMKQILYSFLNTRKELIN